MDLEKSADLVSILETVTTLNLITFTEKRTTSFLTDRNFKHFIYTVTNLVLGLITI